MQRNLPITLCVAMLFFACGTLGAADYGNLKGAVKAYPVLEGMKVLCVKRAMPKFGKKEPSLAMLKSLGFPSNHECQSSVKKTGYSNEIGILDLATEEPYLSLAAAVQGGAR